MVHVVSSTTFWLLPVFMTICYTVASLDECDPETSVPFRLELETDWCAKETTWDIKDAVNENVVYLNGGPYEKHNTFHNETYCLHSDKCFIFTMRDLYGEFDGYYKLFYDGAFFKRGIDFGYTDITTFGSTCPTKEPARSPTKSPTRSPTKSPTNRSVAEVKDSSSGENDKIVIISGTIGGVAGLIIVVAILYVLLWRKGRKSDSDGTKPPSQIQFS